MTDALFNSLTSKHFITNPPVTDSSPSPITSEWSTVLLPTDVHFILEVWGPFRTLFHDTTSLYTTEPVLNQITLATQHRSHWLWPEVCSTPTQIAKFMGPTWGPPGACRSQMGPMLAPWTLLIGKPLPSLAYYQHPQKIRLLNDYKTPIGVNG